MGLHIAKISELNASNPIIARLVVQTNELIKFYPLSERQKAGISMIYVSKGRERLEICYRIYNRLNDEIIKINKVDIEEYLKIGSAFPYIIELNQLCENFLYAAKLFLRDIMGIFNVFYDDAPNNSNARYDKILNWAKIKFGDEDELTMFIEEQYKVWIKKYIDMRNLVEHPMPKKLIINNIGLTSNNSAPCLKAPTWCVENDAETFVIADMEDFIINALSFCEELLIFLLIKLPGALPLVFHEIPIEERDKNCPIKFKAALDIKSIKTN